jgi:hypothetical protein
MHTHVPAGTVAAGERADRIFSGSRDPRLPSAVPITGDGIFSGSDPARALLIRRGPLAIRLHPYPLCHLCFVSLSAHHVAKQVVAWKEVEEGGKNLKFRGVH